MTASTSSPPTAADPRWAAVQARDGTADGHFWYAVTTTGVFCRPSCPSRRPRPEHVRFFDSAAAAREAGFRPCLRCHPDTLADPHVALIATVCRAIEAAETPPSLQALSVLAGLSAGHLQRVFKAATGLSPRAYAAALRAGRVRTGLAAGAPVTHAVLDAGFGSTGRFYARSAQVLGMAPAAWRAGGAGEDIRFAVGACELGALLVAASPRGICALSLGDDPDALVRALQDRFPRACLVGDDPAFATWVSRVAGYLQAPRDGLALPLDLRGTAFQLRVWHALQGIPPGVTISYAELARRVGAPRAVRAVAGACAANPVALAVPCHRVVRSDGSLSGYRWGVERKAALLTREAERGGRDDA
ncbi:MAG TPA: bifunctional DNA-binding transcriptional regulator/O6-methylguanine-DNA methyltransferase Ada [Rhodocyclaceae bacterium]|nr:bifunctional DNA-binding transcriptional regulator/O6-methylguanine-DNA methyltransferase Ada [Rhodocyclaceae bacterium]